MVFKNWHDLCDQFGWKKTRGGQNSRKAQEKDLNTICSWHKYGHKIIIDEVYDDPKERENHRFKFNNKYSQFNIPREYEESMIIYEIVLGNEIYIGSTAYPKKRFYEHMNNVNSAHEPTYDMIKRGAVFNLVQVFEDDELMRMCECELIKLYCDCKMYDCKNKIHNSNFIIENKRKKGVNIKIDIDNVEMVISLLQENGIQYEIK